MRRFLENPNVAYVLAATCVIVSLPAVFVPEIKSVLGGAGELQYPWQVVTSAFMHGFRGFPTIVHLVLNGVLLLLIGPMAERAVGSFRFLMITVAAFILYALARWLFDATANGSSIFIWSWVPIIFVAHRFKKNHGDCKCAGVAEDSGAIVAIMWVIIPLGFWAFMSLAGMKGNPLIVFLKSNLFHITATVAGFIGIIVWKKPINDRLMALGFANAAPEHLHTHRDRFALIASLTIPLVALLLVLFFFLGIL